MLATQGQGTAQTLTQILLNQPEVVEDLTRCLELMYICLLDEQHFQCNLLGAHAGQHFRVGPPQCMQAMLCHVLLLLALLHYLGNTTAWAAAMCLLTCKDARQPFVVGEIIHWQTIDARQLLHERSQ